MNKNFVPSKVTDEECKQMVLMMNHFDNDPEVANYQIRSYKQYNAKDKHYHTKFCIILMKWIDNKYVTYMGDGDSLLGAMKSLTEKMK